MSFFSFTKLKSRRSEQILSERLKRMRRERMWGKGVEG
jgi:hypothetical protein